MITFGLCTTAVLDVVLFHRENGWRAAILVQLIPGVGHGKVHDAQAPRWLAQQNQKEEALEVEVGIREKERASTELDEIVTDIAGTRLLVRPFLCHNCALVLSRKGPW